MKVFSRLITIVIVMAFMPACQKQARVVIATNPQGSVFYSMGSAVAKVMVTHAKAPYSVVPFFGSPTYIELISKGQIKFGLANSAELLLATRGAQYFRGKRYADLRLVARLRGNATGLAVAGDANIEELAGLEGKSLPAQYHTTPIFDAYMNAYLTLINPEQIRRSSSSNFVSAIKDFSLGYYDAALIPLNASIGRQIMATMPAGWQYLSIPASADLLAIQEYLPGAQFIDVDASPANVGVVQQPTRMIGLDFILFTSAATDEALVFELVETLHDNKDALVAAFPGFRLFDPQKMHKEINIPYHPGALKFYVSLSED